MSGQAFYPQPRGTRYAGQNFYALLMARVLQVNPSQGTCRVWLGEGSQTVDAFVMTLHGNAASGWVWLPEVDDLVIVAMLHGHKALPVVLGSIYAREDGLPDTAAGACTLKHQSGASLSIQPDSTLTLSGKAGGLVQIDPNGDIELSNAGQNVDVTLDSNGVTLQHGTVKAQVHNDKVLLDANSGGGGAKIEIDASGAITITPGAGHIINLAGGTAGVMREGDVTSSPFGGSVPDHYHVLQVGSSKVVAG